MEGIMKKILSVIILLIVPMCVFAEFSFSFTVQPIARGTYLGDEVVINIDYEFEMTEYHFRDDGTGVQIQTIEEGENNRRSFLWKEIATQYNIWGRFAFLSQNLIQISFSENSMEYIDISKDYTKAIIYDGVQGDGEVIYSFYITKLKI